MDTLYEKRSWRKIAIFQRIATLVLIAFMLFSSFSSFYVVPFDDDYDAFYKQADAEYEREHDREISISPAVSAVSVLNIIRFSGSDMNRLNDAYYDVIESEPSVLSDAKVLAYLVVDSFEENVVVNAHYVALMVLSVLAPVVFFITVIKILRKYLLPSEYKKERDIYQGVMNQFRKILGMVPFLFFLGIIVPALKFGISLLLIGGFSALGVLIHMVCSWLKDYTAAQRKYRNMLHIVSWLGMGVSALFVFALIRSNLIFRIIETSFDRMNLSDILGIFEGGSFSFDDDLLPLLIGGVQISAIVYSCRFFCNNLRRISMATVKIKRKEYVRFDSCVAQTIYPNIIGLLSLMLAQTDHALVFYDSEQTFFIIAVCALLFMTLFETLIFAFRYILSADLGEGGKSSVLDGTTYASTTEGYDAMAVSGKKKKKRAN